MRRIVPLAALLAALLLALPGSALGYSKDNLMEDAVMDNVNSMSEAQVQEFLTTHGPCLASYTARGFSWNGTEWSYGGSWSAAKIIYEAAQFWGLNPQVIIAKLQQEESLVAGTSCDAWRYQSAMGYYCPDTGGCSTKYAGYELQVLFGAFQIKFDEERSHGNVAWGENGAIVYGGLMLKGTFAQCETCALYTYSGNVSIEGTEIYLETAATAALYDYTLHPGFLFDEIFEEFGFGPTVAGQVGLVEPESKKEEKTEPEQKSDPPAKEQPPQEIIPPVVTPPPASVPISGMPTGLATAPAVSPPVTSSAKPKPKAKSHCHTVVKRVHGKKRKLRVCSKPKAGKKYQRH